MKHKRLIVIAAIAPLTLALNACQEDSVENTTVTKPAAAAVGAKPTPTVSDDSTMTSPGKPSAPISMRYEVLGNPIVGSPIAVNVQISATGNQGPVDVRYSIADKSSLTFQSGQVEQMSIAGKVDDNVQQFTVIPQREGRLYVNVSAEVQTTGGTMIKSMSIPIQVGSAPEKPQVNGELVEGPDGETVISLPAKEN